MAGVMLEMLPKKAYTTGFHHWKPRRPGNRSLPDLMPEARTGANGTSEV
jgi:hypothetical protein